MCGVAGVYGPRPKGLKSKIRDLISNRGPDNFACFESKDLLLCHSRLQLVGGDSGNQPFKNKRGDIMAVNGEVYNWESLKKQYNLKGNSDCEIMYNGIINQGFDFIEKINGEFAFAFAFNAGSYTMLRIGRDRFGIRQLFYKWVGNTFYFASDINTIVALTGAELDVEGLFYNFRHKTTPGNGTCFKGIKRLPTGTIATVIHSQITFNKWYDLPIVVAPDNLESLIQDAIDLRCTKDSAIMLSGGIDSGLIADMAISDNCFTLDNHEFDLAKLMVGNKKHYKVTIPTITESDIDIMIRLFEQPFYSLSPSYYIAKAISEQGLKIVISGIGPDETLGGYHYYKPPFGHEMFKKAHTLFTHDVCEQMFERKFPDFNFTFCGMGSQPMRQINYYDVNHYLPNHHFYRSDKFFMHFGIEGRFPYCDHRVLEQLYCMPDISKRLANIPKAPLFDIASRRLPSEVVYGSKTGLSLDMEALIKGELEEWANDMIESLRKRNIINVLMSRNYQQKFHLAATERWLQLYFDA